MKRTLCRGLVVTLLAMACDDDGQDAAPDAAAVDAAGSIVDAHAGGDATAASCVFAGPTAHQTSEPPPTHVSDIAGVSYPSNPPASGPHCGSWGEYAVYSSAKPLPRCNWIHNLEHGAVVLLYNCPTGCPAIVDGLAAVRAAITRDPDCGKPRIIITPDPLLDVTVAATAWGFTWKANCLDDKARAALLAFAEGHLGTRGQAPEPGVCIDGSVAP